MNPPHAVACVFAGVIFSHPQMATDEAFESKSARKIFGISVAEWVPCGSFKDVMIDNYDFKYLFLVSRHLQPGHCQYFLFFLDLFDLECSYVSASYVSI